MITTLLFDLSRVILFPKDKNSTENINSLYATVLKQDPNYNFYDYFSFNDDLLQYLGILRTSYSLNIFTSGIIHAVPIVEERLEGIFDHTFSTKDLGLGKDDPISFQMVLGKLKKTPAETVYIDDNNENLSVAREINLVTIKFISNEQFTEDLQRLSVF